MNIEIVFFIVFCMLVGYASWKPLEIKSKKNAQKRLLETLKQAHVDSFTKTSSNKV